MTPPCDAVAASCRLLLLAVLTSATPATLAEAQAQPASPGEPGSELTVSVITLGQGDQVWERYGHNALWIHDAARGTDRTYNWGVFDASDPRFIVRFVRGRMRYWLEVVDVQRLMEFYRSSDRSITIQRLALSPAQRIAIRDFVEWNAREENKYYWYDYFRDNCSTRLRDAVDRALGGGLRRATESEVTRNTYRSESIRLMEGMPLTQAGIAIGLGPVADRKLTGWEEMFVPMRMRDRLREVRIAGPDGRPTPLVAEERQAYVARRASELQQAPPLLKRYAAVGVIAAVVIVGFGLLALVAWSAPFAIVTASWSLLSGIGGILLLFLWLGTHHLFAYRNENLFHSSPFAVVLAVLAPLAVYRPRVRASAWRLAAAVVGLSLLGFVLKALPGFDQDNLFVIALVLPGHLAVAWALMRLARAADRRATVS
ncbi:MAG: DUF4105 domain-containing protein [Gemmatimonadota bacterium]|nr:DUF4105 domain-containing protein [Gemmatimonadota bacterium]